MRQFLPILLLLCLVRVQAAEKEDFAAAAVGDWQELFFDSGTKDWQQKWFLDGEIGVVKNSASGMEMTAGQQFKDDAHHMVLWSKESFAGDLKIEYDYTRLDVETRCVNILYIQASGSGQAPYDRDIAKWSEQRRVPAMRMYYNHMHAYHISYAAFPNNADTTAYIRARRYMPEASGLKGTDLAPDYSPKGLFATGVPHKITVIKKARDLYMRIKNAEQTVYCHMRNPDLPAITEGRIGLRHMFTRSARYQNFRVSRLQPPIPLVADTHQASLAARERALRKTIAQDNSWPSGAWGETLWSLAALHLNQKVARANAQLLKRAKDYIALHRAEAVISDFSPEEASETPWAYFGLTDYLRILYGYADRLTPATKAAMTEALWLWVKVDSKLAYTSVDKTLLLLGTENHDLTRRTNHYLAAALLKDDPAYRDRAFDDGHSAAEHAAAYTSFFREWPRQRASSGLWFEVGSDTYQKYSWPALFNLHELAPDALIRQRFGLLLDLAFIEEAQISVRGRRGGGRSRAGFGKNGFESYKNLLYAPAGRAAGSSHSRVIETSAYQLPAAAILLRKQELPAVKPFVIRNRVLGEQAADGEQYLADSALVNYAYRTPHYLLGSTLQDPRLSYGGLSRQKRWCGLICDDPRSDEPSAVYPIVEQTRGGRPQHSHWSVQHENVLLIQRIGRQTKTNIGSYSTGKLGIRFQGDNLQKVEASDWIFASNGKAYVGVKFLDGPYEWDKSGKEAQPLESRHDSTTRILMHAGDIREGSFEEFRTGVLASDLRLSSDTVEYRSLQANIFDGKDADRFALPRINGEPIDLRPATTYQSPYLNAAFGSDRISVTVGPVSREIDFSK